MLPSSVFLAWGTLSTQVLWSSAASFVVVGVGVGGVVVGVVTNRVTIQNLRTVVGIDLLFLIDWYEWEGVQSKKKIALRVRIALGRHVFAYWCHKSCPHPNFKKRNRYWPNSFFNRLIWRRRCAEPKYSESAVKVRWKPTLTVFYRLLQSLTIPHRDHRHYHHRSLSPYFT